MAWRLIVNPDLTISYCCASPVGSIIGSPLPEPSAPRCDIQRRNRKVVRVDDDVLHILVAA